MLSVLIAFVFQYLWRYRSGAILENLRYVFPESSAKEHAALAAGYYRHVSTLLTSPLILDSMSPGNLDAFVDFEGLEELNAVWADGRDAVLMASHFGNWEYMLSLPLFTPFQVVAVCAKIQNSVVQKEMTKLRSKYGATLVYKEDFYRYVLSAKKRTPTLYVVIADQRPSGLSKQCVDFFGRATMVQTGAERIAKHLKCPVFYTDVIAAGRWHYTFRVEPITQNAASEETGRMMVRYYELLEATIRRNPELWLWSHRRWKNFPQQTG